MRGVTSLEIEGRSSALSTLARSAVASQASPRLRQQIGVELVSWRAFAHARRGAVFGKNQAMREGHSAERHDGLTAQAPLALGHKSTCRSHPSIFLSRAPKPLRPAWEPAAAHLNMHWLRCRYFADLVRCAVRRGSDHISPRIQDARCEMTGSEWRTLLRGWKCGWIRFCTETIAPLRLRKRQCWRPTGNSLIRLLQSDDPSSTCKARPDTTPTGAPRDRQLTATRVVHPPEGHTLGASSSWAPTRHSSMRSVPAALRRMAVDDRRSIQAGRLFGRL